MATRKEKPLAERFAEAKGRARYDAWAEAKGTGKDDAMKKCVALVGDYIRELGRIVAEDSVLPTESEVRMRQANVLECPSYGTTRRRVEAECRNGSQWEEFLDHLG